LPLTAATSDYTSVLGDAGFIKPLDKVTAILATIPPNSSVAYLGGAQLAFRQINTGQATLAPGAAVTLNYPAGASLDFRAQGSIVVATKRATGGDTWDVDGDLKSADAVIFKSLLNSTGSHIAAKAAGTYALGQGDPAAVSGTGTLYPINMIYVLSTEYPANAKMRLNVQVYVNDAAPTGNFTFGLYPITRPGTSGGTGLNIYTMGTVISGSTVLFTTPAADSMNSDSSTEFTIPADGHYAIGFVSTATVGANSLLHMVAKLQVR
jgi:hypothetical protein